MSKEPQCIVSLLKARKALENITPTTVELEDGTILSSKVMAKEAIPRIDNIIVKMRDLLNRE